MWKLNDSTLWSELALLVQAGQHYEHAPIVEAILEIRVQPSETLDVESLKAVAPPSEFREPAPQFDVTAELEMDAAQVSTRAHRELAGYASMRHDGRRALRSMVDRFSYSWLKPYENWESFSKEALQLWEVYCARANPSTVTRLGVRFVNKIDVEKPSVEVRDYLRTGLDISPYLPQAMSSFFIQVDVPLARHEATARVISALATPEREGVSSLILDIDVWREVEIELDGTPSQETLVQYLDVLRDAKNYVFEACITDATRGVIR